MVKGDIDNPIELLIYVLIVLAILMLLFKFQNWLDARPVKEKKKKEKKVKAKEVKIDEKKELNIVDKDGIIQEDKDKVYNEASADTHKDSVVSGDSVGDQSKNRNNSNFSNYLYDRFVTTPTIEDRITDNKDFQGFLTDEEASDIKNRNIKINVNQVDEIPNAKEGKNDLYKKIEQMASENLEAKEKMLQEFESLPKSMKLLLIENIIQKM